MRRNDFALAVALIGATLATLSHAETTAASTNNQAGELHVVKAEKFMAYARTAKGEEHAALWSTMVEIYGPYAHYQTKTDRQIPIVVLEPV